MLTREQAQVLSVVAQQILSLTDGLRRNLPRITFEGSILHPQPSTLNPKPCTLQPTPYTLHPTPYTLHPTPYTLNPLSLCMYR